MTVRAKFYLSSLELFPGQDSGGIIHMQAVARGDRNAQWAQATPSGSMQMTVNNPAGFEFFEQLMATSRATGKQPEVYIDIAPAADGWAGDGHKFRLAEVPETHYLYGKCGECSFGKDDKQFRYDATLRRSVETDELVHPNG